MRHLTPLKYIDAVAKAGSIRKAAEKLSITSTALNRRILAMEEDLGVPIFDRLPQGVRLSVAGELLIHHIRHQLADMDRLRSQIADLSGERRGHVSIYCGQAMVSTLLPPLISAYRSEHPQVTFSIRTGERGAAREALVDHVCDIAILFEPDRFHELQLVADVGQSLLMLCNADHPLAEQASVRFSDCLSFPMLLPTASNGIRHVLERAARRLSQNLTVGIESDNVGLLKQCLLHEPALAFQLPVGMPDRDIANRLHRVEIDERDMLAGRLVAGHLRGRTLSVAAARFMDRLVNAMHSEQGMTGAKPSTI